MITKFESKGILGIPDIEIELGNEKIIIIKGANGSGKTSLLRQITHPLSSHNRFNRLRPGVDSGHTIMELSYKGNKYRIQHLYTQSKKNATVLSYIAKWEDYKWKELSENGLPTRFKELVKTHLDYDEHLYSILNIGVENRGMVDFTNVERIEYLKKILKLEVLNELKTNVLDNLKEGNSTLKYIKAKLQDTITVEEATKELKEVKEKSVRVNKDKESKQKDLLEYSNVSDENIKRLEDSLEKYILDEKDLSSIIDIVPDKEISYNDYIENLKTSIIKYQTEMDNINNQIGDINSELLSLKDIDVSQLQKDKEDLHSKIDYIESKYKGKDYKDDISLKDTTILKIFIESIKSIIDESEYSVSEIKSFIKLNDLSTVIEEHKNKMKGITNTIEKNKNELQSIDISHAFINIHPGEDDCKPTCSFRQEYNRQMSLLDRFNSLTEENKELQETYEEMMEEGFRIKGLLNVSNSILSKEKPDKLNRFFQDEFINILDVNLISDLLDTFIDYEFYHRDSLDLLRYKSNLELIESTLKIQTESTGNRRTQLLNDIDKYNNKLKELELKIEENQSNIKKSTISINNMNNAYYTGVKCEYLLQDIQKEKNSLQAEVNELKRKKNMVEIIQKEITTLDEEMQKITDRYYDIKNSLKDIVNLNKEYQSIAEKTEKLKILSQVVSKKLPARVLEGFLHNTATSVNTLLEDFLNIRFNVEDGIDIIANRDGVERLANSLSQGEKSMLSIALLMSLKRSIPWDIISLDEIDATLDENNRNRFIYLVREFSETINNLNQIFIVSHTDFNDEGLDVKVINL